MGRFEVNTKYEKAIQLDWFVLGFRYGTYRELTEKELNTWVNEIRNDVWKKIDLEEIPGCNVKCEVDGARGTSVQLDPLEKGEDRPYGYIKLEIAISRTYADKDILEKLILLMMHCVKADWIEFYWHAELEDKDEWLTYFKADMCEKCRRDAENIVESLGSEILGIEEIQYDLSGSITETVSFGNESEYEYCEDVHKDYNLRSITDSEMPKFNNTVILHGKDAIRIASKMLNASVVMSDSIHVVFSIR